jgi:hypothetical protein
VLPQASGCPFAKRRFNPIPFILSVLVCTIFNSVSFVLSMAVRTFFNPVPSMAVRTLKKMRRKHNNYQGKEPLWHQVQRTLQQEMK